MTEALHEHFHKLIEKAQPWATQSVQTMTGSVNGGMETRDDDPEIMELPMSMSK